MLLVEDLEHRPASICVLKIPFSADLFTVCEPIFSYVIQWFTDHRFTMKDYSLSSSFILQGILKIKEAKTAK